MENNPINPGAQPDPTPMPSEPAVFSPVPPKKSKKGLIIALAAVLLLVGGMVGVYFWYQSPKKVVADAINKASSTKVAKTKIKLSGLTLPESAGATGLSFGDVEMEITGDIEKMSFEYNMTANLELMGKKAPLKAKMMLVDKKDVYFYIEDVSEVVNNLLDSFSKSFGGMDTTQLDAVRQMIAPVIAKVENQWVKLSLDELPDDAGGKTLTCVTNTLKNFDADKYTEQVKAAFKEHNFYQIDSTKVAGSNFVINTSVDKDEFKAYGKKIQETDLFKSLTKCSEVEEDEDEFQIDDEPELDIEDEEITDKLEVEDADDILPKEDLPKNETEPKLKNTELVVSKWGHELKELKTEVEAEVNTDNKTATRTVKVEVLFDWPNAVEIKSPNGAIKFEDWLESIKKEAEKLGQSGDASSGGLGSLFL